LLLRSPDDPKLVQYRIPESEYGNYSLAALYGEYWNNVGSLKNQGSFITLPPNIVPSNSLYIFNQYEYMTKRVDALRKSYQNAQWGPPGLAVIGTPGIGELVPIHLFCGLDNLSGKTMFLARRLGVNIPGVNKSGIGREFIMTTCGYTYNIP